MNKISLFFKHRSYSPTLVGAGIIFISLLIFYFIVREFEYPIISIWISVQELGLPEQGGYFTFQIVGILKMVLLGPVHSLICYGVIHSLIGKMNTIPMNTVPMNSNPLNAIPSQVSRSETRKGGKSGPFLDHTLVLFLMLNTTGHIVHWLFDRSNFLYREEVGDYNTNPVFLLIYASDEFLGHALIHISYYIIFFILTLIDIIKKRDHPPKWDEYALSILVAGGIFILNGYAAKEGESALILTILSIGSILIFGIMCIRKKEILRSPIVLAFLLGSIATVAYNLSVAVIDGILPFYPYIT